MRPRDLLTLPGHTLVIPAGRIEHALYPACPTDRDAEQVIARLHAHPG